MGKMNAGTQLDFFMIANGANGGSKVYSNQPSSNSDGLSHMLAYTYTFKDSAYLVLAFDDSSSNGDRSFSDLVDTQQAFDPWRQVYNTERPHSSLDYLTPAQFAQGHEQKEFF